MSLLCFVCHAASDGVWVLLGNGYIAERKEEGVESARDKAASTEHAYVSDQIVMGPTVWYMRELVSALRVSD
jgi:hypothetical protein